MKKEKQTIDVLIVGGGPAGTSTALSLLNYTKHSVMVIEQSNLDTLRVGEHVSSSIFNVLEYLKIDKKDFETNSFCPVYGNTTYWGSDYPNTNHTIFTTESSTFQLDRELFDVTLIEKVVERGGIFIPRSKGIEFTQLKDKSWEVRVKHPDKEVFVIQAKYLVDATGRSASVSRQIGVPIKKYDTLMGVGAFLQYEDDRTLKHEHIVETTALGWWYTALLPNKTMVATLFTDAAIIAKHELNHIEAWNAQLQQTKHIKHAIKGANALGAKPWVRNACTQITNATTVDNFIAIGDAASSFDPISSMGIGFSMTSACHAATYIRNQLSDTAIVTTKGFQQDIVQNFQEYLKLRLHYYQQERRWESSDFWKQRQQPNAIEKKIEPAIVS